jgi:hypothetical protein
MSAIRVTAGEARDRASSSARDSQRARQGTPLRQVGAQLQAHRRVAGLAGHRGAIGGSKTEEFEALSEVASACDAFAGSEHLIIHHAGRRRDKEGTHTSARQKRTA